MNYTKTDIQEILLKEELHIKESDGTIVVVAPEQVAIKQGIDVYTTDLSEIDKDICGFIKYEDEKFSIVIEQSHHINRRKFTLAHELGHYFLHPDIIKWEGIFIDNKETMMFRGWVWTVEETQANMFAAEYLMPESEVRKLYDQYGVTEILATHFKVSLLAMAYRIDNVYRN